MIIPLKAGDKAPNFQFNTPWTSSQEFYQIIKDHSAALVFLRYHGCPICQMEMANLKRDIELFNRKEVRVFVFLQSTTQTLASLAKKEDWPFDIVCDPEGAIFQLYAVEPGGILKYLHPAGLAAAIKAIKQGYHHKKFEGKEKQLPAAFIIKSDKTIKYAYYGKNVGDIPTPLTLAENLD